VGGGDRLPHPDRSDVHGRSSGFILLSDILGVSTLVDAIGHDADDVTDSTVLGPFYTGRQRELANGDSILLRPENNPPHGRRSCVRSGRETG
jgi:hypothetical protein